MDDARQPAVLITGASSGVGRAAAFAFAEAGYAVALMARTESTLRDVAAQVEERGGRALVLPMDVTDREGVGEAVAEAERRFDGLDVVVLNAATTAFGPFSEVEADDFDRVFDVGFLGMVNVARAAVPALERNAGTLVSVGSLNARVPLPGWSSYCAAKHAGRGFLNTLAIELREQGSPVRVAQLHPGTIDTPVWDETESAVGHLPRRPPGGHPPEEIAQALVRLAESPRREVVHGPAARALDLLWTGARPVATLALGGIFHFFLSGDDPERGDVRATVESAGRALAGRVPGL